MEHKLVKKWRHARVRCFRKNVVNRVIQLQNFWMKQSVRSLRVMSHCLLLALTATAHQIDLKLQQLFGSKPPLSVYIGPEPMLPFYAC